MNNWLEQAIELRDGGQISKAIDLLEQAVAAGDESAEICKELARLSLTVNEVRAFANWCHEATRIDGADPEPHIMIGRHLCGMRRWDEAAEALGVALKLGIADDAERAAVEELRDRAAAEFVRFRRENPGYSNL
jgi:uncharacterized protein HemY